MKDLTPPISDTPVNWEDDPRNLGRLGLPSEVMLNAYGAEALRMIEISNAAAEQASGFITTYVVGQ